MSILVWDYKKNIIRFEEHQTISLFTRNTALLGIGFGVDSVKHFYQAANNSSATFRSGWLGVGGLIPDKVQDRGLICYKGDVTFRLFIDEVLQVTRNFSSEGIAVEQFKFPLTDTRNNFVEVELVGSGEVFEIFIPQESANG